MGRQGRTPIEHPPHVAGGQPPASLVAEHRRAIGDDSRGSAASAWLALTAGAGIGTRRSFAPFPTRSPSPCRAGPRPHRARRARPPADPSREQFEHGVVAATPKRGSSSGDGPSSRTSRSPARAPAGAGRRRPGLQAERRVDGDQPGARRPAEVAAQRRRLAGDAAPSQLAGVEVRDVAAEVDPLHLARPIHPRRPAHSAKPRTPRRRPPPCARSARQGPGEGADRPLPIGVLAVGGHAGHGIPWHLVGGGILTDRAATVLTAPRSTTPRPRTSRPPRAPTPSARGGRRPSPPPATGSAAPRRPRRAGGGPPARRPGRPPRPRAAAVGIERCRPAPAVVEAQGDEHVAGVRHRGGAVA